MAGILVSFVDVARGGDDLAEILSLVDSRVVVLSGRRYLLFHSDAMVNCPELAAALFRVPIRMLARL